MTQCPLCLKDHSSGQSGLLCLECERWLATFKPLDRMRILSTLQQAEQTRRLVDLRQSVVDPSEEAGRGGWPPRDGLPATN